MSRLVTPNDPFRGAPAKLADLAISSGMGSEFSDIRLEELPQNKATLLTCVHKASGLPVCLILTHAFPENFFILTVNTPPTNSGGIPHLDEHIILDGNDEFPFEGSKNALHFGTLITSLGAVAPDRLTLYHCASEDSYSLERGIRFLCRSALAPTCTEAACLRHRGDWVKDEDGKWKFSGVLYDEMVTYIADPEVAIEGAIRAALFPDSPFSFPIGGDPIAIRKVSPVEIRADHRKWYFPANMDLIWAGPTPFADRLLLIDSLFRSAPRNAGTRFSAECELPKTGRIDVRYPAATDVSLATSRLVLCWHFENLAPYEQRLFAKIIGYLNDRRESPLQALLSENGIAGSFRSVNSDSFGRYGQIRFEFDTIESAAVSKITELVIASLKEMSQNDRLVSVLRANAANAVLAHAHSVSRPGHSTRLVDCAFDARSSRRDVFEALLAPPDEVNGILDREPEITQRLLALLTNSNPTEIFCTPDEQLKAARDEETAAMDSVGPVGNGASNKLAEQPHAFDHFDQVVPCTVIAIPARPLEHEVIDMNEAGPNVRVVLLDLPQEGVDLGFHIDCSGVTPRELDLLYLAAINFTYLGSLKDSMETRIANTRTLNVNPHYTAHGYHINHSDRFRIEVSGVGHLPIASFIPGIELTLDPIFAPNFDIAAKTLEVLVQKTTSLRGQYLTPQKLYDFLWYRVVSSTGGTRGDYATWCSDGVYRAHDPSRYDPKATRDEMEVLWSRLVQSQNINVTASAPPKYRDAVLQAMANVAERIPQGDNAKRAETASRGATVVREAWIVPDGKGFISMRVPAVGLSQAALSVSAALLSAPYVERTFSIDGSGYVAHAQSLDKKSLLFTAQRVSDLGKEITRFQGAADFLERSSTAKLLPGAKVNVLKGSTKQRPAREFGNQICAWGRMDWSLEHEAQYQGEVQSVTVDDILAVAYALRENFLGASIAVCGQAELLRKADLKPWGLLERSLTDLVMGRITTSS